MKRITGWLTAVDRVDLTIPQDCIIGLVGESGSGKTTLGRLVMKLLHPSSGEIRYRGRDLAGFSRSEEKEFRKNVQMLFQDPFLSLNPRRTVFSTLAQPLRIHRLADSTNMRSRIDGLLSQVGLEPGDAAAFPHELSGGARQRVALAAALAVEPRFIFCDEPVAVLDASARAQVLNLMREIQSERKLTLLIVSHDLPAVEYVCDDIAVMYLGGIVEHARTAELFGTINHPYTEALLASMPERALDPQWDGKEVVLEGEIPSPVNLPSGCRFHTRCPKFLGATCVEQSPPLWSRSPTHTIACHAVRSVGNEAETVDRSLINE
jgi:oligopeptide/dipeptide ABC transporter ATP-binding protein